MREDDDVACREAYLVVTRGTSGRVSIRHEVEQHQPLAVR